jgi:hypothetical protein
MRKIAINLETQKRNASRSLPVKLIPGHTVDDTGDAKAKLRINKLEPEDINTVSYLMSRMNYIVLISL